ncbi:MAG: hypothetical protein ABIH83_03840 [Candidatus Micrarchaeota archaeon]
MEEKKSKGSSIVMLGIIVLLGIMIIGAGYYWMGQPKEEVPEEEEKPDLLEQAGAVVMLEAHEKRKNIGEEYSIVYDEKLMNGNEGRIRLESREDEKYFAIEQLFSKREVYWGEGKTIMCENDINGNKKCAEIGENGSLKNYTVGILEIFLGVDDEINERNKEMINSGMIKFIGGPEEKEVGGRVCTGIMYQVGDFEVKRCYDDEFGIILKREEYPINDPGTQYLAEYEKFEVGGLEDIAKLEADVSIGALGALLIEMDEIEAQIVECKMSGGEDSINQCVMVAAIDGNSIEICRAATNESGKEECVMKYALRKEEGLLCGKAGTLSDECYLNFAYIGKDTSYCTLITSKEVRDECEKAVEGGT